MWYWLETPDGGILPLGEYEGHQLACIDDEEHINIMKMLWEFEGVNPIIKSGEKPPDRPEINEVKLDGNSENKDVHD